MAVGAHQVRGFWFNAASVASQDSRSHGCCSTCRARRRPSPCAGRLRRRSPDKDWVSNRFAPARCRGGLRGPAAACQRRVTPSLDRISAGRALRLSCANARQRDRAPAACRRAARRAPRRPARRRAARRRDGHLTRPCIEDDSTHMLRYGLYAPIPRAPARRSRVRPTAPPHRNAHLCRATPTSAVQSAGSLSGSCARNNYHR